MKPKLYFIPLALVLVCALIAAAVRFSYTDAGDKVYDYQYVAGDILADLLKKENITSPQDVISRADLIVKAKYNGERKITSTAFFSQVKVSQVYKGDGSLIGKELCIIETVSTFMQTRFVNAGGHFAIPLQSGEEYILLLKPKQFDPYRKLDDSQKTQYYPVTQGAFGCYRISDKRQTEIMDEQNKIYTVNTLKGMDVYATDGQILDTYYQYRDQIFSAIGA